MVAKKFKWFEMATSVEPSPMYFIVPESFNTAAALTGGMSESELGNAIVAQAQTAEWAGCITAALNSAGAKRAALQRIANLPMARGHGQPDPHLRARRIAVAALGGNPQKVTEK